MGARNSSYSILVSYGGQASGFGHCCLLVVGLMLAVVTQRTSLTCRKFLTADGPIAFYEVVSYMGKLTVARKLMVAGKGRDCIYD